MPFRSESQMRAAFGGYLGKEMKDKAKQWADETPNENDMYYIGTVMLLDDNYVLHAYVKLNGVSV